MCRYPFPDRVTSKEELKRDLLYQKIPVADREKICGMAWEKGKRAAEAIMMEYPDSDIWEIIESEEIKVTRVQEERVNGGLRIFGEYDPQRKELILYRGSILKWAKAHTWAIEEAEGVVAAHEFYHYLESTRIGETSKLYEVPVIYIGKCVLVRAGIRTLSEIGAYGFSRTYKERS